MDNIFAHVDCNNFYASCERVFNPALKGKPVVILSNNDGCIVARSNEAKALGIGMGVPYFKVKDIIHKNNVYLFSSNYTLYGDMSSRVMSVLAGFTPNIEYYSIDEAFLSLKHIRQPERHSYGNEIRRRVRKHTGIPVSIGIAPTKVLAKIANEYVKKNTKLRGVLDITGFGNATMDRLLDHVPVYDVWGIGNETAKFLMANDIYSALHYKNTSEYWIQKRLGVVGLRVWHELRGKSCLLLDEITQQRKAIMSSRSFGRYVTCLSELEEAVSQYTTRAAEKIRLQKTIAGSINVFIQTNHHKITDMQHAESKTITLPEPTAYTPVLIDYALYLLRKIYKPGYNYIKAGVLLEGLVPESSVQLSVFESNNHLQQSAAMKAMDAVNTVWGRDTMRLASSGIKQAWKMKTAFVSKRYTTNWNELMTVNI